MHSAIFTATKRENQKKNSKERKKEKKKEKKINIRKEDAHTCSVEEGECVEGESAAS
jgi:hypothetical protein